MTKSVKILAILGQILFAWIYSNAANSCIGTVCTAKSYISLILLVVTFAVFDRYFLTLYPRFRNVPSKTLLAIILLFPVLFYLAGVILITISSTPLVVIIIGLILVVLARGLWMILAKGKIMAKTTEYLALVSLFFMFLGIGFMIANLNFAISSYLKYHSPYNDVYITKDNGGKKNFINFKFR